LPQAETLEHLLDHVAFVNEGDDAHFTLAGGADEGIGLPLFDKIHHRKNNVKLKLQKIRTFSGRRKNPWGFVETFQEYSSR
jgi:hypothetical protein